MSKCKVVVEDYTFQHDVEVMPTIVGRGVFACRPFEGDALVGEIKGAILSADHESDYCMHVDDHTVLEPAAPFRFLNHSCMPNCELQLWKSRKVDRNKVSRLWLRTLEEIEKGQEMTIDYAWPADFAIPCLCRAKQCRGWIVDPDELAQVRGKSSQRVTPK